VQPPPVPRRGRDEREETAPPPDTYRPARPEDVERPGHAYDPLVSSSDGNEPDNRQQGREAAEYRV
jgi:hypothetical protein